MNSARHELFGVALASAALWLAPSLGAEPAPLAAPADISPDLAGALSIPAADVLLAWGSDATILRSVDGLGWSRSTTPGHADLTSVASNSDGSVLIAVGQASTLLRSTDAGHNWRAARSVKEQTDLRAVVNVPGTATWLAVGTLGRILRSIDDGKNWKLVRSDIPMAFLALYHDAGTGAVLVGGEAGFVAVSLDQGQTWKATLITMPEPVTALGAFHRFDKLLLATSTRGRFLVSGDGAQSWDLNQASINARFTGAAWDPAHSSIVLTADSGDVLRSVDGGQSWESGEIAVDERKVPLGAILFDARSQSLLVTGQGGVLARSADGGKTWSPVSSVLRGELRGLVEHRGKLVAYGSGGAIAVSADSGLSWTRAH